MRRKIGLWLLSGFVLFSCSGMAIDDHHFVLDPVNRILRGKTPNDDLPESLCNPDPKPDGTLEYKCVTHFFADYQKLLLEIARLRTELKSCQQGQ